MPHIIIEHSANIEPDVSPQRLVDALHRAALETGVFPIGGLRTRAVRREVYRVADGNPSHGFIAVVARIGAGRSTRTRQDVAQALMTALEIETAELFAGRGLGLTVEIQEIDPVGSLKTNNLHAMLAGAAR